MAQNTALKWTWRAAATAVIAGIAVRGGTELSEVNAELETITAANDGSVTITEAEFSQPNYGDEQSVADGQFRLFVLETSEGLGHPSRYRVMGVNLNDALYHGTQEKVPVFTVIDTQAPHPDLLGIDPSQLADKVIDDKLYPVMGKTPDFPEGFIQIPDENTKSLNVIDRISADTGASFLNNIQNAQPTIKPFFTLPLDIHTFVGVGDTAEVRNSKLADLQHMIEQGQTPGNNFYAIDVPRSLMRIHGDAIAEIDTAEVFCGTEATILAREHINVISNDPRFPDIIAETTPEEDIQFAEAWSAFHGRILTETNLRSWDPLAGAQRTMTAFYNPESNQVRFGAIIDNEAPEVLTTETGEVRICVINNHHIDPESEYGYTSMLEVEEKTRRTFSDREPMDHITPVFVDPKIIHSAEEYQARLENGNIPANGMVLIGENNEIIESILTFSELLYGSEGGRHIQQTIVNSTIPNLTGRYLGAETIKNVSKNPVYGMSAGKATSFEWVDPDGNGENMFLRTVYQTVDPLDTAFSMGAAVDLLKSVKEDKPVGSLGSSASFDFDEGPG